VGGKHTPHQFREDGSHYNGGAEWFGYGYRAVGEPRLKMVRRWYRQGERRGKTEDRFSVDGQPVASYEAAVEALKTPPVLTAEERPFLALFSAEPGERPSGDLGVMYGLREKGFIAVENRLWRITDAGRAALSKAEASDVRQG
jgi:hypothetical protein